MSASKQGQLFFTPTEAPNGPYKTGRGNQTYTGARKQTRNPRYARPIASSQQSRNDVLDRKEQVTRKHALVSFQQFMPVTQLKHLESGDFVGETVGSLYKNTYRHSAARSSVWGRFNWNDLHNDIAKHGIKVPLSIRHEIYAMGPPHATLMNGHHRAMSALEHGHMFVPVQENSGNPSSTPSFDSSGNTYWGKRS